MALFSPSIMSRLESIEAQIVGTYDSKATGLQCYYQFKGTWSDWCAFVNEARSDGSPGSRELQTSLARHIPSKWAGTDLDTVEGVLKGGTYTRAFYEFEKTRAKLEASHYQPDAPKPAVSGGVWIIPLVLSGNPMAARIRPRAKLPPVDMHITLSVVNFIAWEDITRSIATLARGVWNYIQAGGAATLTIHYVGGFHEPQNDHKGFIASIKVPTSNIASFASCASAQEFRGMFLSFAQSLSGKYQDTCSVTKWNKPGLHYISGDPAQDAKVLQALRITSL
jgi:hypothetical protein